MLETHNLMLTSAPGATSATVQVKGDYVKYKSGNASGASARIRVKTERGGGNVIMLPGEWTRFEEISSSFYIENVDGSLSIAIELVIGRGEMGGDRVAGSVEVIDGEKSRTAGNLEYVGVPNQAAVAGQFSVTQLFNPTTNRNLIIRQVSLSSAVAVPFNLYFLAGALAGSADQTAAFSSSKRAGGVPTVAQIRAGSVLAAPTPIFLGLYSLANVPIFWTPKAVLLIPPGQSLAAIAGAVNSNLVANFEWSEEAVQ
jgi:hypothetical protein